MLSHVANYRSIRRRRKRKLRQVAKFFRPAVKLGAVSDLGMTDQLADAMALICFVRQHARMRTEVVEQHDRDLASVCLPGVNRAEGAMSIDDDVDFGREPASGAPRQ